MIGVGFIFGVLKFLVLLVVQGTISVAVVAGATRLWRLVRGCRDTFPARPFTLLVLPIGAALVGLVLSVLFLTRLPNFLPQLGHGRNTLGSMAWPLFIWLTPWLCLLAAPLLGVLAGLRTAVKTHLYATRWGRVMMRSNGRYLALWLVAVCLAAGVRLLPHGWLSTPTMALASYCTVEVLVAHVVLYLRFKHLERQCFQTVKGPPIQLGLSSEEAAVVAALANVWASRGGAGQITSKLVADEICSGERLNGDISLALLSGVREGWERLAGDPARVEQVMQSMADDPSRGLLTPGYLPGPQLERLLRMGGMARTITLGSIRYAADGDGVTHHREVVIAQAGGAQLDFEADEDSLSLTEIKGEDILRRLREVFSNAGECRGRC